MPIVTQEMCEEEEVKQILPPEPAEIDWEALTNKNAKKKKIKEVPIIESQSESVIGYSQIIEYFTLNIDRVIKKGGHRHENEDFTR